VSPDVWSSGFGVRSWAASNLTDAKTLNGSSQPRLADPQ
jgi:hypothetical protein